MTIAARFTAIRDAMATLRYQVRPEGDQAYGALSVAVDQAESEALAGGTPPEPTPIEERLDELAADAQAQSATLAGIVGTLTEIRTAVGLP
jgi:hypothetical protein